MTTIHGLTELDLRGPAFHCAERLIERYGLPGFEAAFCRYLEHYKTLAEGQGEPLYESPQGGVVYLLKDQVQTFYPVWKAHRTKAQSSIIVTYLSEEMVYNAMMGEGPRRFRVK